MARNDQVCTTQYGISKGMTLLAVGAAALVLGGCTIATTRSASNPRGFDERGNIQRQFYQGGGIAIDWTAPAFGTAYLVERSTQRILKTQSLEGGQTFTSDQQWLDTAQSITGGSISELQLDLYFVPEPVQR